MISSNQLSDALIQAFDGDFHEAIDLAFVEEEIPPAINDENKILSIMEEFRERWSNWVISDMGPLSSRILGDELSETIKRWVGRFESAYQGLLALWNAITFSEVSFQLSSEGN